MNSIKEFVVPTAVLTIICLVVSLALSVTYSVTNPIIEENSLKAAQEAMMEVLPAADGFTEVTEELPEGVDSLFQANNGSGVVTQVSSKGYGGAVVLMVGIDQNGQIAGVKVLENSETQGLGSRVMDAAYTGQFVGKSSPNEVESISGSTVSSNALKTGIQTALDASANYLKGGE